MLDFTGKANTSIHGLGEDDTANLYLSSCLLPADLIRQDAVARHNLKWVNNTRPSEQSKIVHMLYKCFVFAGMCLI